MSIIDSRKAIRESGAGPLEAAIRIREDRLFEVGREYEVAVELKEAYDLTIVQAHEVAGWLRGLRSLDDLREAMGQV